MQQCVSIIPMLQIELQSGRSSAHWAASLLYRLARDKEPYLKVKGEGWHLTPTHAYKLYMPIKLNTDRPQHLLFHAQQLSFGVQKLLCVGVRT